MIRIESEHNPRIKKLKSLKEKRGRVKENAYLIEGEKLLSEALRDIPDQILEIVLTADYRGKCPEGIPAFQIPKNLFDTISSHKTPQGVLGVVSLPKKHKPVFRDAICIADNIRDPGNLGTLIRTAEAFNFQLLLFGDCVDPYNPKVIQASMGSILRVQPTFINETDLEELCSSHSVYALVLEDSGSLHSEILPRKTAFVIGSESHGVSAHVLRITDRRLYIPMAGRTESLNAAISGAIVMHRYYEIYNEL